jgi:D-arginine dehydrogenase
LICTFRIFCCFDNNMPIGQIVNMNAATNSRVRDYDVVVIGAGIAGASIAAHVAEHASVCLIDMEHQPGYHSTGRSAALFAASYGNETIRSLTRASRRFFAAPPPGFGSVNLLNPREALIIARDGQTEALQNFMAAAAVTDHIAPRSPGEALKLCPILRSEELAGAAQLIGLADIEVHELHQGFLRMLKACGGSIRTEAEVVHLERDVRGWLVGTAREAVLGRIVVNAAGAWADGIARLAGAQTIGLQPLKRTVCLIDPPAGTRVDSWPMIINVEEEFYLKADAGMLLLSPADETLTKPCDAQPDEMDIAVAVDRLERATTLKVKRIAHRWAGLRSFVADRSPVVGFDNRQPDFFWMAALGGYGIQTSPALGRAAASLVLRKPVAEDLLACGVDVKKLAPERLHCLAGA